jgi:peptide/nickel transport system substrate-binding protein
MDPRVLPLLTEMDEVKRIAGYKAVDRYLAEEGIALPLLQYVQPVVHRKGLKFTPHVAGVVLPQNVMKG